MRISKLCRLLEPRRVKASPSAVQMHFCRRNGVASLLVLLDERPSPSGRQWGLHSSTVGDDVL